MRASNHTQVKLRVPLHAVLDSCRVVSTNPSKCTHLCLSDVYSKDPYSRSALNSTPYLIKTGTHVFVICTVIKTDHKDKVKNFCVYTV
ncbi:hypothetical protein HanIR_Chr15g0773571 [Helianthus annuus]|nr:hypothetical protein HanIR_Chr15g0773571 [Helianthus annuus]